MAWIAQSGRRRSEIMSIQHDRYALTARPHGTSVLRTRKQRGEGKMVGDKTTTPPSRARPPAPRMLPHVAFFLVLLAPNTPSSHSSRTVPVWHPAFVTDSVLERSRL